MAASCCPLCNMKLPLSEIEWHVNNHLDEDEFSTDRELALQLAATTEPSPRNMGEGRELAESYIENSLSEKTPGQKGIHKILEGEHIYSQICYLISCQTKGSFYRIEEGFMTLLGKCLESERGHTCSVISGHIDHFQSMTSEDLGWGCGWRNIQMLSSHLLTQTYGEKEMLFGGSGFVPDIPSLQRWLEIAWQRGFDIMGADSFNSEIYGSKKWIGTTECASLLRSFGLRARIVDFGCEAVKNRNHLADASSQADQGRCRGSGPIDKFLHLKFQCDGCGVYPIRGNIFASTERENFHLCSGCMDTGKYSSVYVKVDTAYTSTITCNDKESSKGKSDNHQVLFDWVWNYFMGHENMQSKVALDEVQERIVTSHRTPLYFQHDGHSRTIVGIQRRYKPQSQQEEAILLVLDPAQRTQELARALRESNGWQKFVKRGVHTLRKPEYQLLYVDPGIACGDELEQLKIMDSKVFKY